MTLDDLKKQWRADLLVAEGAPRTGDLRAEMARVRRDLRMRDVWMILPLVAVAGGAVFFNWWARDAVSLQSRIGVLAIVASAVVVTLVLLNARRITSHDDWTLRARLEREMQTLGKQVSLLLNVGYWFLLPMFLTIVVTSTLGQYERTGSYLPGAVVWGLYGAYIVIAGLAHWLCKREAKRRCLPLLSRLKELHGDLVGLEGSNS
jgi:hypothetical protein